MFELQFGSVAEFLAMGGYAKYVWLSYGTFVVLMTIGLLQPYLARRRIIRQQRARLQREELN